MRTPGTKSQTNGVTAGETAPILGNLSAMPRPITPAENLTAHVRQFCAKRHMPFVVCAPVRGGDNEDVVYKVCNRVVKFTGAELAVDGDDLVALVAKRIKAIMP